MAGIDMVREQRKVADVIALYIGALIIAAGALGVQLFAGHDGGGGDATVHDGDTHAGDHDGPWSFVASLRFWCFLLLAFGLVGTATTLFHFASPLVTFIAALVAGVASGVFAVTVIRALSRRTPSSLTTSDDVVGLVGRVIVPASEGAKGKVRIDVKGSYVDCVAVAREPLSVGDSVVVEECEGAEVTVSRAPKELG
jgi:membrane protein implicated in regulation of membrane protease activity